MWARIFYGPSDWFIHHTNARQRAAINFWLLFIWIIPGVFIWYVLRDALWFVGFMSIYAIWVSHFGGFSAETPVENENGD
jgi:hypothetical protein